MRSTSTDLWRLVAWMACSGAPARAALVMKPDRSACGENLAGRAARLQDVAHAGCIEATAEELPRLADGPEQRTAAEAGGREIAFERGGCAQRVGAARDGDRLRRGARLAGRDMHEQALGPDFDKGARADGVARVVAGKASGSHIERHELAAPQRGKEADEQQRAIAQGAQYRRRRWRQ